MERDTWNDKEKEKRKSKKRKNIVKGKCWISILSFQTPRIDMIAHYQQLDLEFIEPFLGQSWSRLWRALCLKLTLYCVILFSWNFYEEGNLFKLNHSISLQKKETALSPEKLELWVIFWQQFPNEFLDEIASPSTYPCQSVGESVSHW